MDFRVKIERKHIEAGRPGNTKRCAIALALREAMSGMELSAGLKFSGVVDSFTGFETYKDGKPDGDMMLIHSQGVKEFIVKFDRRQEPLEPVVVRFQAKNRQRKDDWRYGTVSLESEEIPAVDDLPRYSAGPAPRPKKAAAEADPGPSPKGPSLNDPGSVEETTGAIAVCLAASNYRPWLKRSPAKNGERIPAKSR